VLADAGLKKKLAENGYARVVERFEFHRTATAYQNQYESQLEVQHRPTHAV
jgi:hypothetical protein